MLSFEISAVDLVLFVAVIIVLLLYLKLSTNFDWLNQMKRSQSLKTVDERTEEKDEVKDEKKMGMMVSLISGKCPYNFGYLRKLSDDVSIPTECLECARLLECRYEIISDSE
jgi:hypothetical protein